MKVIITAGGTGGHIYPALAILNKIKEIEPTSEFIYIGTHNRMEKDIVPKLGIKYESLEIYGFDKKKIGRDIKNLFLISKAYNKSKNIIKEFKPDVVIGVGGYVTFPVILAAKNQGVKTFIHEQNSIPGKSNKFLEKYVDAIGISFSDSKKYFKNQDKVYFTGNPCSENAIDIKPINKTKFGIKSTSKLVLIVSGSLGSNVINSKMIDYLNSVSNKDYEVIYVTGNSYFEEFNKHKFSKNVHVLPYIENMSGLLKNVDVVVSRAGASSLSEIIALKVPSIIIPSPYVANNHQYYNAMEIKNNGGGEVIEEKDLTPELLSSKINKVLENRELYLNMKSNLKKMSMNNSSDLIYSKLKDLIK